jgi:hypothetical protein
MKLLIAGGVAGECRQRIQNLPTLSTWVVDLAVSSTIAIGDIHGCSDSLASVLRAIDAKPEHTIICLGE